MFICICNAITERQVQSAVAEGAVTLSDLQGQLGVGTCCGCCSETAGEYLPGGRYAGQASIRQEAGTPVANAANDPGVSAPLPMVAVAVRRA
ncbi:(2Fe-2S)-binding protein [Pollutimonas bauzanensis]|uniref:Bacterioferritin-associated ferredoxin n=1 Tax=Pollutimonas bauzanensis TaxID=658167 RepID=A0A1M5V7B2_9BURK|nr:(2Fe-2S)-binding protein [Pollutimonas bauzanensis]SHH70974.1 bacterioferritin-associated ferredoxin [Pollutimonas bauzanensis]